MSRNNDHAPQRRAPLYALIAAVAVLHLAGLGLLGLAAGRGILLFGLGGLAYLLGLRHAFDVDHIAAIDNVTRKLTREGHRPLFVGFSFSLGHSTVVFGLCLVVIAFAGRVSNHMSGLAGVGGFIGTVVSAAFLTVIALVNLQILRQLWRRYRHRDSAEEAQPDIEGLLDRRGLISRWLGRCYRWIDASWKMYPLGLAFGLGFDTATEVALLGMSAAAAQHAGWAPWMTLALPLLFAAGMTLMDSANGLLMLRAYRWGDAGASRRLGFSVTVTALSVALALLVGVLEWIQVGADYWAPDSAVAAWVGSMPTALCGLAVVLIFVVVWLVSAARQRSGDTASQSV